MMVSKTKVDNAGDILRNDPINDEALIYSQIGVMRIYLHSIKYIN